MPFTVTPCPPFTATFASVLVVLCGIQGCASTDSSDKKPSSEFEPVVELCVRDVKKAPPYDAFDAYVQDGQVYRMGSSKSHFKFEKCMAQNGQRIEKLSSGPAYGEWVAVTDDEVLDATIYVDFDTLRRNGELVEFWAMMDSKAAKIWHGTETYSGKMQLEFDCAEQRMRLLTFTLFTGPKGRGDAVYTSSKPEHWSEGRGPFVQIMWKRACGK